MAEVIPQINIDGTKIKNTWTEKEYVTDEVYNALNKAVIDLKNNNNLLDSNSILFREEYNSSSKNLNNAIHQGVYSFTNSAVNAPSGVNGGNLLVTNTSKTNQGSSIITQIAFCHNGAVYARTKNTSENFTSWNKLAYITDNVASATKATQDSEGQQINTTYLNHKLGNITDFNNATTEGIYHFFAIGGTQNIANAWTNSPVWGTLMVYNNNNTVGSGTYLTQVAFPTAGNIFIRKNTNGSWGRWDTIPYINSPAFTGTPTSPTPATSDNSTKIATTAFVKSLFTASKATNGWHKEASTGFIWQWGQEANYHDVMDKNYGSSGSLNFPISFPNECLAVMPYLIGSRTFCCVSVSSFTNATITVHWDEWASDVQSVKFGYIAVGY